MTIRVRGNTFQVDVKVGANSNPTGKEVRVRVQAPTRLDADRMEAEIRLSLMKTGTWSADATAPDPKADAKANGGVGTLGAALEEAWSYPAGRRQGWKFQSAGKAQYAKAKQCVDFLGPERHCASVTTEDLERLTAHFIDKGNGNDTICFKIQAFYRTLWHAQRKGWITHRPLWDRPAPGKPREFIFTPKFEAEVIEFFDEVERDPTMRDLFILGIETGLRLNEILKSTAGSWDLDSRIVYVKNAHAKGGHGRAVTLTDRAIEIVKPRIKDRPDGYRLFTWSRQVVAYKMRRARTYFKMTDEQEMCFHATRHTRATRLARETRDPFTVMSQLGHSDIAISMRYIKLAAIPYDGVVPRYVPYPAPEGTPSAPVTRSQPIDM